MIATPHIHAPTSPEKLCIGIDIGKLSHYAGIISRPLLVDNKSFKACPVYKIENSRVGFEQLKNIMISHAPLGECVVLLEKTGHYGNALVQYLQEAGIEVYEIHVQKQGMERNKSDKLDALSMANTLYNQYVLGVQVNATEQKIKRIVPATEAAQRLRTLIRRRYELIQDATRRKNKLVAICDELFPEFSQVFADVNGPTALAIREQFPMPSLLTSASLDQLKACRIGSRPSDADLLRLKELAQHSIGVRAPGRVEALTFEQGQLIAELQLMQKHITDLDNKIAEIVEGSREGKILLSLSIIGPVAAGAIIAGINNIGNFDTAAQLRSLLGWAPHWDQTGTSRDSMTLSKRGNRPLKLTMYLIGWRAVRSDTEWHATYERLVPIKCQWDARQERYKGKNKVIGRVIGQIIGVIFYLLKKDYETIAKTSPGETPPPPVLYDRDLHRQHRHR